MVETDAQESASNDFSFLKHPQLCTCSPQGRKSRVSGGPWGGVTLTRLGGHFFDRFGHFMVLAACHTIKTHPKQARAPSHATEMVTMHSLLI